MSDTPTISRREALMAAASAVTASSLPAATAGADSPATQPTAQPTAAQKIASADVATAANRVAGHDFSAAECEMMVGTVTKRRERMQAYRATTIHPNVEPAIRFDPRLAGSRFPLGLSSFHLSQEKPPDYNGDPASLAFASVAELSRLIHAGKVTSVELTRMYLDRLESIGPKLNCLVNSTRELAMKQAEQADRDLKAGHDRGPLHGVPWGAKDLLATAGIPTTWGVKPLEKQVFDFDATVVSRLAAAGAVLIGKLSLGELAMGDVWFGGLTRNPWKPETGSSGSSAGPGAATAAGLVGFSIGSETLGSIVSPCVVNGVTGLRPTYGRVSRYGAMALCRTMDKIGPMCRAVEDCAMVLSAIHGSDGRDPTAADNIPFNWDGRETSLKGLRIGVDVEAFAAAANDKDFTGKDAVWAALAKIKELTGGELIPVKLPATEKYAGLANFTIACESSSAFNEMVDDGRVRELVQQRAGSWPNSFRAGSLIPASDYIRSMRLRTELMHEMETAMRDVDLYVTVPNQGPSSSYTNLAGQPSLVTRCGMAGGLPVSIEFIGQLYREDAILRAGLALERVTTWHTQWPDVSALKQKPS
jgi:Asp-tRNA(Asn)/Glu-tRNA(Gln) amidotransferase A subunit family amidase